MTRVTLRFLTPCVLAALGFAAEAVSANDIVRCRDAKGAITYQPSPCPDRTEESRPQIPASYPEPNKAESQRIFEREAALDKRLEARRDRETQEQQMREARAEREAERERAAQIAAAQQQQQYVIAYPLWRGYGPARPVQHLPRYSGPAIR